MKVVNIIEIIIIVIIAGTLVYEKIDDDALFMSLLPVGVSFIVVLLLVLLCDLCPESIVAFREFLFSEV